jgi:hypothetical protein
MTASLTVTKLGFVSLLLRRGGLKKLAIAGLLWRILPRRLKRYVIGWAAVSLIVVAVGITLVVLLVTGTI